MKPSYAELLEAQLYDAPNHVTEQQQIQRLEAELTELRRRLDVERSGMDRIRGLGNAVVPQVAEHVGRLIVAHDASERAA
jgi:hypothetical protein